MTHYNIPHGIAVSFGMDIANFISLKMGILKKRFEDIRKFFRKIWKGYSIVDLNPKVFCSALAKDKKMLGKNFALFMQRIWKCF